MKATKQFATDRGTSHLPSNMIHIRAEARGILPPDAPPVIVLELQRIPGSGKPTYLRLRMSPHEAEVLRREILNAIDSTIQ